MKPQSASPAVFAASGAPWYAGRPAGVSLHRPEPVPEVDPDPQPDDGNDGPPDPPVPTRAPEGDPPSRELPERCEGRAAYGAITA